MNYKDFIGWLVIAIMVLGGLFYFKHKSDTALNAVQFQNDSLSYLHDKDALRISSLEKSIQTNMDSAKKLEKVKVVYRGRRADIDSLYAHNNDNTFRVIEGSWIDTPNVRLWHKAAEELPIADSLATILQHQYDLCTSSLDSGGLALFTCKTESDKWQKLSGKSLVQAQEEKSSRWKWAAGAAILGLVIGAYVAH